MNYIPPCFVVYRLFRRTDGALIYVGSTGRWGLRMSQHERDHWWWSQVGDTKLEDCASEREALVIEDIAIKREKPLYNKRVNFAERKAAIAADEDAYMERQRASRAPCPRDDACERRPRRGGPGHRAGLRRAPGGTVPASPPA